MELKDNFCLGSLSLDKLFNWIKENNLGEKKYWSEKPKWDREVSQNPNFFSNTELLLVHQDILLLKVASFDHASFLAKTYRLEHQEICQKLFSEKKHVLVVSSKQWERLTTDKKAIVLLKDEESIKKNLTDWFQKLKWVD